MPQVCDKCQIRHMCGEFVNGLTCDKNDYEWKLKAKKCEESEVKRNGN